MSTINTELVVTLADKEQITVQTTLEDRLAFESTLRKNKGWGKLEDNTLKMQPFMAWNALRRSGKTDLTWEQFTSGDTAALDVSVPSDDEDDESDDTEVAGLGKDTRTEASTSSPSSSPETTAAPRGSGAAKKPRS